MLPKICCFILLTALLAGCKKDWLEVNYNPLDLTDQSATPDVVLPGLLERSISSTNTFPLQEWMGYWSHWRINQSSSMVNYNRPSINGPDLGGIATTISPEINFLEQKSFSTNQLYYAGIAKVIKALQWCRAVDIANNVPYREAFKVNILQPKYDDGKFIYEDAIRQLDTAIVLIKQATELQSIKIIISDIMFHGDKTKWVKFINTLKLRLLVHQANRPDRQTYIAAQIQKITSEGSGFLGSGENASVNPGFSVQRKLSQYFGYFSSHNFLFAGGLYAENIVSPELAHANYFSLEMLKRNNDPRLGYIYSTVDLPFTPGDPEPYVQSPPLDFRGNKSGYYVDATLYPSNENRFLSAVGGSRNSKPVDATSSGIIKGFDMDDWIMTSTESMFLQAEAIQRGWITGDPETAYKDAVKESFRWLNVGENSNDPGLSDAIFEQWYNNQITGNNVEVSWAAAPDKYKLIMLQKYIAFNGIEPLETWTDYRRNGRYPNIPVSESTTRVGSTIPIRLLYAAFEYVSNSQNVNAQGDIDIFTSKIWWMP